MPRKRHITVIQDTREQRPFLFPRLVSIGGKGVIVSVEKKMLLVGDYALEGGLDKCVIERKGCIEEVAKNLLDETDRRRQLVAFDRLAQAKYPVLVLEQYMSDLLRPKPRAPDPGAALDALFAETMKRNIHLWFVGNCGLPAKRRLVGELILRAMVNYNGIH